MSDKGKMEAEATDGYWLDAPTLEPAQIETPALAPDPYPLDSPTCVIELEDDGDAITAYRLRRPGVNAETGLDEFSTYAQILDRHGKIPADCWLFDQIAMAKDEGSGDWVELTPELKRQVPDAHKRQAIYARYLCRATVLEEESEVAFFALDSSWCVQLLIGPPGAPAGALKLTTGEWSNEHSREYRSTGVGLAARLPTATRIFDSIFQSVAGGTVADLPFATERRAEFLRWLEAPFKLALLEALVAAWETPVAVESVWVGSMRVG